MKDKENTRRNFLKKMFAVTVVAATCPHVALGTIEPTFDKHGDKKLKTSFYISLKQYPALIPVWGYIRIAVPDPGFWFPDLIIIHLPKEKYGLEFAAINEICPHEGNKVSDPNPEHPEHWIRCPAHGTLFEPDGTYIDGPAAQDLETFTVIIINEETISIELPFTDVELDDNNSKDLFYMRQNIPNPAYGNTSIDYGVEKSSNIVIEIFDNTGAFVDKPVSSYHGAGHYTFNYNTRTLSSGIYLYKMTVENRGVVSRKMIVRN